MDGHGVGTGYTVLLEATPLKDLITKATGDVLLSLCWNETMKNEANVVYVTV